MTVAACRRFGVANNVQAASSKFMENGLHCADTHTTWAHTLRATVEDNGGQSASISDEAKRERVSVRRDRHHLMLIVPARRAVHHVQ